ncbi:FecR domain-containing protein [Novosphingobium sp. G106]|uniref:FecR family protein n=1 Tax=Novosphingobium sp. G106 TaxID=2849500 RepID=UPI001C2D43DB|nr:FecR domain-containing protein [Novosphingobium sp. G106]MBV1691386.1 FecR domain-containing protein [Novosphingobium sp. G106]
MTPGDSSGEGNERFLAASRWFARMRGPDAEQSLPEFEDWCRNPANRQTYGEMEAIWMASASARPGAASAGRNRIRPGLIAAGIATAVTLGLLVYGHLRPGIPAPTQVYGSERGVIREVALADGSHVVLDTASQVSASFDHLERKVALLAGRARFKVMHDTAHPFVVTAAGLAVVARGTIFDVRIDAGRTEVSLVEGAVDLESRGQDGAYRVVGRLRPGETATFASADLRPRIARLPQQSWTAGIIAADGMRLSDLLSEANRYSAAPIRLADPSLGDLTISGGFRPADSEQLAQALASALSLRVMHGGDGAVTLTRTPETPVARAECRTANCFAR